MIGWQDKKLNDSKRNVGVVIMRAQPIHNGHLHLIKTAMDNSELVVILIGSAQSARSIKNPWNELERTVMLHEAISESGYDISKVRCETIQDHHKDEQWLTEVLVKTKKYINEDDVVTLYGNNKDATTYYLSMFPYWRYQDVGSFDHKLDATLIRKYIFEDSLDSVKGYLPVGVYNYIDRWMDSREYEKLCIEYNHQQEYKKQFEGLPYDPFFVTVDAVVTHRGRVLITKRKALPGLGLNALPGGFIRKEETLFDGVRRIVSQKAGLNIPKEWFVRSQVFDSPGRSLRGRTITHAYRFDIPANQMITPNDDSWFMDFADVEIHATTFFEDHKLIISEMIK